jgi:hypothetical protein
MADEVSEVTESKEQLIQLEDEKSVIRKLLEGYKEKILYANQSGDSSKALELTQEMK